MDDDIISKDSGNNSTESMTDDNLINMMLAKGDIRQKGKVLDNLETDNDGYICTVRGEGLKRRRHRVDRKC